MKIAAIADLHMRERGDRRYRDIFMEMERAADVIALCGDLTDSGSPREAERLAEDVAGIKIPVVAVFGNHDHDGDHVDEIKKILSDGRITLLEDEVREIGDFGFAGTKGFGGGFGRFMFASFGEPAMKRFAEESVREALKLETNLQKLNTKHKIVILHYAPTLATVHGEPPEIYPFLGSSRLGEVIERFGVRAVFHGHAHAGTFEAVLRGGARVYNCAQDVIWRYHGKPYAIVNIEA